jgi:hypothetical protein
MHGSHTRRRAADQAPSASSSITFVATTFKQRDQWSRKTARDPRVKLMHRHVLRSLSLCARVDHDGKLVIDPTYDDLAEAAACNRRTAMRAVTVAEEIGIVRKTRHSDGRVPNSFELLLPAANGDKFAVPTVTNIRVAAGSNGDSTCHRLKVETKGLGLVDRDSVPLHSSTCGERDTDRLPVGIDSERDHKNGNSAAGKAAAVHCGENTAIRTEAEPTNSAPAEKYMRSDSGNGNGAAGDQVRAGSILNGQLSRQDDNPPRELSRRRDIEEITMRKPESRREKFAKLIRVYPKDKLGDDLENAFDAFCLSLDVGNDLNDLIYGAIKIALAASQGADVAELCEFLLSTVNSVGFAELRDGRSAARGSRW